MLSHLNELCQDVVAFSAVSRQLVIRVTLEDISTSQQKLSNNFQMTTVGRQVQSGPLVDTSRRIHVKFFLALSEEIVELGDGLYTLLLALSHGCMHGCPVISIL